MPLFPLFLLYVVLTQWSVHQIVCSGNCGILCSVLIIVGFSWFWCFAGLKGCIQGWVFGCRFGLLVLQWSTWSWHLAVVWGFVRPSPPCLRGRASSCLCASHTSRVGNSWSLIAFSRDSNKSLVCDTDLWKWVHLEHIPLVNAEYVAWGSSCTSFYSKVNKIFD